MADHPDWPAGEADESGEADDAEAGLVAVLVAREHRYDKVAVCGWLVDVYCMGVRDVLGPRAIAGREVPAFVERYFDGFPGAPVEAPIGLARQLVWGAVEYARGLGFEPAPDFEPSTGHLGALDGKSDITFGRNGRPTFVRRPQDDAASVLTRLEAAVGKDGFDVVENAAEQGALARAGFTREGVLRGAQFRAARWHDIVVWSVLRSEV